MMTGSDGVSFLLPQLFLSQHRLKGKKGRRGEGRRRRRGERRDVSREKRGGEERGGEGEEAEKMMIILLVSF